VIYLKDITEAYPLSRHGILDYQLQRKWQLLTPQPGFEPGTSRLTVGGSTAELLWNKNQLPNMYSTVFATSFIASLRSGRCPDSCLMIGLESSVNDQRHSFMDGQYQSLMFMFRFL
jgi:hypothetical protein